TEFTNKYLGKPTKWTTYVTKEAIPNDILMSVRAPVGPVNIANQKICIGRGLAAIRCKENILVDYLFACLKCKENDINGNGGAVFDSISRKDISSIKVPLPPLHIQEEIVKEIEGYQKIIDGAIQVVENYKPTIKIDPSWEMVRIGDYFADTKLGLVRSKGEQGIDKSIPYIKMDCIVGNGNLDLSKVVYIDATKEEIENYSLRDLDFIYNTRNTPELVGKSAVYRGESNKYIFNNNILRIRFKSDINPIFINLYLNSNEGQDKVKRLVNGTTSVAAIYQKDFASILVPLPSPEIQQNIVEKITEEMSIIEKNKRLIEIFEQKIKDKITEVWGD
ncbi:MAG: hypothetical protein GYA02_05580, partial [Clostridiaceae bacterium]|nr:hypothetical protein [Clostridiaceae bacterium]